MAEHSHTELNVPEINFELASSSEEEEIVEVYDGLGNPVNLEPNSRKVKSKVPLLKRRCHQG